MSSTVSKWYEGKRIFLTGATGCMGKVLVEKLLRSCNVEMIYVLIRPKQGQSPEERLKKFLSIPLFDQFKTQSSKSLEKLYCVTGDITENNLGIDEKLLDYLKENVDVVFHMAADVRFREPLKKAVLMNLRGSYNMLELAKKFRNLSVYVHVSTSYCHVNEEILEEKMYPAPHDPRKVLDLMQLLDDDSVESVKPFLTKDYPNTYAYTKCLAEELVGQYAAYIRIAIVRPSMVTASYMEPVPGWIDNLNGPTGLMVGASKGLIRSIGCDLSHTVDLVPVDITINRILVVAKDLSEKEHCSEEPLVVNLTAEASNSITWEETLDICTKHTYDNPHSVMLWYPNGNMKTSRFWHTIAVIFFHYMPAYIIDFLLMMCLMKPFLVRTQRKISKGLEILSYYSIKTWIFKHNKICDIYSRLPPGDKEIFKCDMTRLDWNHYLLNYTLGIRRYVMREDPATIPRARKLLLWLFVLDTIARFSFLCLFISIITYSFMT